VRGDHGADHPVDQRRLRKPGPRTEHQRLPRHRVRAAEHRLAARLQHRRVGPPDNVRGQHGEQRVEVPAARGGQERFHDAALPGELGPGHRRGTAEPEPGLLDGVVSVAQRAQHSVGHRAQLPAVSLEPLGQPIGCVHRSPFALALRLFRATDQRSERETGQ
jgi:hypothetical protein